MTLKLDLVIFSYRLKKDLILIAKNILLTYLSNFLNSDFISP